jgi:hypothetical protein
MRKVTFLIAVCVVLAVMVATIAAQAPAGAAGGGGGRGGGGGQRGGAPPAPTGPAPTGANGAADLQGIMQRVSATNRGMGPKVMAGDAAGVAEDLGTLQSLFMAAQTAFAKEKSGAEPLAKAAAAAAGDAQKVAKSGKVDAATTKAVTDSCNGCHNGPPAYRTKDPGTGAYMLNKP